jgi:hypothetical protein
MNTRIVKIATNDEFSFWRIGEEVYRAKKFAELDTQGQPMGKRWECSYALYVHYRAVEAATGSTVF